MAAKRSFSRQKRSLSSFFLFFLLAISPTVFADYYYKSLIDSDDNSATGCTVEAQDWQGRTQIFSGAEIALVTAVSESGAQQQTLNCSNQLWVQSEQRSYSLALDNDQPNVEQQSVLQAAGTIRIGFLSSADPNFTFADVLFSARGLTPAASGSNPGASPIPALSPLWLVLLAVCVLLLVRFVPRRSAHVLLLLVFVGFAGYAITSSVITVDGQTTDWGGVAAYDDDVTLDASRPLLDIKAGYAVQTDNGLALRMQMMPESEAAIGPNGEAINLDAIANFRILSANVTEPASNPSIITVSGNTSWIQDETGVARQVSVVNTVTGIWAIVALNGDGTYTLQIEASVGDRLELFPISGDNQLGEVMSVVVQGTVEPEVLPDPKTIAPPLSSTEYTSIYEMSAFLYQDGGPIQKNVAGGTIIPEFASVLVGKVLDTGGNALSGVTVTVKEHPEYGYTYSRDNGDWDLAVNGGQGYTVEYKKRGYLPVQRKIDVYWQEFGYLPDVAMTPLDERVTFVDLTNTQEDFQVHVGTVYEDESGPRRTTVFFPKGLQADLVMPDGTTQAIQRLNVRTTEYTVGQQGPNAMPGALPPETAYTYAFDLSIDEAIEAGAESVSFSQPVIGYLDDFLDIPVGTVVPVGSYGFSQEAWLPEENGLVIKVLAVDQVGLAVLDVNGEGQAATGDELAELEISELERREIARRFEAGKVVWRFAMIHASPWDLNYGYICLIFDCEYMRPPLQDRLKKQDEPDCEDTQNGCVIYPRSREITENIELTGSDFNLVYSSEYQPKGESNKYRALISKGSFPDTLVATRSRIIIREAGVVLYGTHTLDKLTSEYYADFYWDGKGRYGRKTINGCTRATSTVYWDHKAYLSLVPRRDYLEFWHRIWATVPDLQQGYEVGFAEGRPYTTIARTRDFSAQICVEEQAKTPVLFSATNLGDWTLDVYHSYDPVSQNLYRGNGISAPLENTNKSPAVQIVFQGKSEYSNLFGTDPQGNFLTHDDYHIYRVDRNTGEAEALATTQAVIVRARVNWSGDSILFATRDQIFSYRIKLGTISLLAGDPQGTSIPDVQVGGQDPKSFKFENLKDFIQTAYGAYYLIDGNSIKLIFNTYRTPQPIGTEEFPSHMISKVTRNSSGFSGDGGPAIRAQLSNPTTLAYDPDNKALYVADTGNYRVRRISLSGGVIDTVAGTGVAPRLFDTKVPVGQYPLETNLEPTFVGVDPAGQLIIDTKTYEGESVRIFSESEGARFSRISGGYAEYFDEADDPAANLANSYLSDRVANMSSRYLPIGGLRQHVYFNLDSQSIALLYPVRPHYTGQNLLVPDGEVFYEFNPNGRHLKTLDRLSGAELYSFEHNLDGTLKAVIDHDGLTTEVEAEKITAPFGQVTGLAYMDGHLASVENPAGERYQMRYYDDRLLQQFEKPDGSKSTLHWDFWGKLARDVWANGGGWEVDYTYVSGTGGEDDVQTVSMHSAEGRTTDYVTRIKPATPYTRALQDSVEVTYPDGSSKRSIKSPELGYDRQTTGTTGVVTTIAKAKDAVTGADFNGAMEVRLPDAQDAQIALRTERRQVSFPAVPGEHIEFPVASFTTLTEVSQGGASPYQAESSTAYDYDASQWRYTSPEGRETVVEVDKVHRPLKVEVPGLPTLQYLYNDLGQVVREELFDTAGVQVRSNQYSYYTSGPSNGYLSSITDALGRTSQFDYDLAGRVVQQTLPDSRQIQFSYYPDGEIREVLPPGRPAYRFVYDGMDDVTSEQLPDAGGDNGETVFRYNLDRDLTEVVLPTGQSIVNQYGASSGQLIATTAPGRDIDYSYDAATGQLLGLSLNGTDSVEYEWNGPLLQRVVFGGTLDASVDQDVHLASGELRALALTDEQGSQFISQFSYDLDGLLLEADSLSLEHRADNGLLVKTQAGEVANRYEYNGFAELARIAVGEGGFSFNSSVNSQVVTQPQVTVSGADLPDTIASVDFSGFTFPVASGAFSGSIDLEQVQDQHVVVTYQQIGEGIDRPLAEHDFTVLDPATAGQLNAFYYARGDEIVYLGASNTVVRYNRVSEQVAYSATVPAEGFYPYSVDADDRQFYYNGSQINVYSAAQELLGTIDGVPWVFQITANGNVYGRDGDAVLYYPYSGPAQVLPLPVDSYLSIRMADDAAGDLLVMTVTVSGDVRIYAYQPGQLELLYATTATALSPGASYIDLIALAGSSNGMLCYQYYDDLENETAHCLYPDGQGGYDQVAASPSSYWYSYSDNSIVANYYNYEQPPYSIVTRPGIDDAREDLLGAIQVQPITGAISVTGSQTGETGTVLNLEYAYDAGGQITGILESRNGGPELDRQYQYDTAGRLIEESRGAQTTTWQYDANGNRTHENGSLIATYDGRDRLLSYRDSTFTYNALGQPTQIATPQGNWGFSHDVYGNLLNVSTPAGDSIDYIVDPLHRRIGRKVNGATTHLWVYKDQINPVAELYPSGAVKYHFTYAEQGHVPSLMRHYDEAGNLLNEYRYITDHLGSVLMLIDIESNAIVQAIEYDAWGNVLSDTNPGFQPFYYAGGVYDQTTKLTKFGYRDYQAETGRFVQSDPIGLVGGLNTYVYAGNSPLIFADPLGLDRTSNASRLRELRWSKWPVHPYSSEHIERNKNNKCPQKPPSNCPDGGDDYFDKNGDQWSKDNWFTSGWYHGGWRHGYDTWRNPKTGSQCTYDGNQLIDFGPYMGTFDYKSPNIDGVGQHFDYDVQPHNVNGEYTPYLTETY